MSLNLNDFFLTELELETLALLGNNQASITMQSHLLFLSFGYHVITLAGRDFKQSQI